MLEPECLSQIGGRTPLLEVFGGQMVQFEELNIRAGEMVNEMRPDWLSPPPGHYDSVASCVTSVPRRAAGDIGPRPVEASMLPRAACAWPSLQPRIGGGGDATPFALPHDPDPQASSSPQGGPPSIGPGIALRLAPRQVLRLILIRFNARLASLGTGASAA